MRRPVGVIYRNETERMVPIAEHITGPGCIAEGLEVNEKLGGKGVFVIPAKHMYPFHWLMNDPEHGGTASEATCMLIRRVLLSVCLAQHLMQEMGLHQGTSDARVCM